MNYYQNTFKNLPLDTKNAVSKPIQRFGFGNRENSAKKIIEVESSEYSDPEIEEEDSDSEEMFDMDIRNISDPLKVSKIADTIFINDQNDDTLSVVTPEKISSHHSTSIDEIRKNVITWIIYIAQDYSMGSNTWYQAIEYFDYLLAMRRVPRKEMHAAGITCLWIASKFVERTVPKLKSLASYFKSSVSTDLFLSYEKIIMQTLDFQLSVPTPKLFIRRYLDVINADSNITEASNFFCELSMWEITFHNFHPDILAISSVALGKICLGEYFPKERIQTYSHNQDFDLVKKCCQVLLETANDISKDSNNIIYQRYSGTENTGIISQLDLSMKLIEDL